MDKNFDNAFCSIDFTKFKLISFDIFDTLISRYFIEPNGLFFLLEKYALIFSSGKIANFAELRKTAEDCLEKQNIFPKLYDIYQYIQNQYFLDKDLCRKLYEKEMELEFEFSCGCKYGMDLYAKAREAKVPIVLTSDMYLETSFLEELLDKHHIVGYQKIFVSCESKKSKKNGELFKEVLSEYSVKPHDVLHIGDNLQNDINKFKKLSGQTFWVAGKQNLIKNHIHFAKFCDWSDGNLFSGLYLGLVSQKYYNQLLSDKFSHFFYDKEAVGYIYIAPVLYGYILWLCNQLKNLPIKKVYFFSREGKILKEIYDKVKVGITDLPDSEYLYVSRKFLERACLFDEFDLVQLAGKKNFMSMTVGELLFQRFGVRVSGKDYTEKVLGFSEKDKDFFIRCCLDCKDIILSYSRQQRELYLSYLSDKGFLNQSEIHVIDIGWQANLQRNLSRIVNKKTIGYYLFSHINSNKTEILNHAVNTYILANISNGYNKQLIYHCRHLLEELICCEDGSFLGFEPESKKLLFADEDSSERKQFITGCHSGIKQFVNDVLCVLQEKREFFPVNIMYHTSMLEEMIVTVGKNEKKLFSSLLFKDHISNKQKSYTGLFKGKKTFEAEYQKIYYLLPGYTFIEKVVCKLLLSENKYKKYQFNRLSFFYDSKSLWVKWYIKFFGKKF